MLRLATDEPRALRFVVIGGAKSLSPFGKDPGGSAPLAKGAGLGNLALGLRGRLARLSGSSHLLTGVEGVRLL